jgi:hypothetical protein
MDNQGQATENVGFPTPPQPQPKRGIAKWIIFVILLLAILGAGVFFLLRSSNEAIDAPNSTPNIRAIETVYTPEPEPESSTTPTPAPVDKSKLKVEVLNGTGTPGDAGTAKDALTKLGFTQVETGNAPSQTATAATVTFDSSIPETVKTEVTTELEKMYQTVNTSTGTVSGGYNIRVTTGVKKGSTTAAKATPRATTSASATPRASVTPKPTATP